PGLLNADPKILGNTVLLDNISYYEAIELSYYGATVIHPKTLKPLHNKNIPLRVRSFEKPELPGTVINNTIDFDTRTASYIFKFQQVLLKIFPRDFSFIAEQNLSLIFSEFARNGVKINLMQNSAISFSVCFDIDKTKTPSLIKELNKTFDVQYLDDLELITIRHYLKADTENLLKGKEVLLEQKSSATLQIVAKKIK
ncbi:MAG: aspartate kinase, partial [Bacteroidales bacterium]|nr:aspartate kinase [Bacteroidales bacterium]